MTICIAAMCGDGQAVVAASDKMMSASFLAMEFEHPSSKIERLDDTCLALSAGDALVVHDLFAVVPRRAEMLTIEQDEGMPPVAWSVGLVAETVASQYCALRRRRCEQRLLQPRGLDLDTFYGGAINQIPTELAVMIDAQVQQSTLGADVLIAGVDEDGAHIFGVDDPGEATCFDRLGYHAVGSGMTHALLALIGTEHSVEHSVNQTVYQVYEAKRRAEVAQGVGHETEMAIVRARGTTFLGKHEMAALEGIYKRKTAPRSRAVEAAIGDLPYGD